MVCVVVHLGHHGGPALQSAEFRHHHQAVEDPDGRPVGRVARSADVHRDEVAVADRRVIGFLPHLQVSVPARYERDVLQHVLTLERRAGEVAPHQRLPALLPLGLHLVEVEHLHACRHERLSGGGGGLVRHLHVRSVVQTLDAIPVYALQRRAEGPQPPVVLPRIAPFIACILVLAVFPEPFHEPPLLLPVLERDGVVGDVEPGDEHGAVVCLAARRGHPHVMEEIVGTHGSGLHRLHVERPFRDTAGDGRHQLLRPFLRGVRPYAHLGVVRSVDVRGAESLRVLRRPDVYHRLQHLAVALVLHYIGIGGAAPWRKRQFGFRREAEVPRGIPRNGVLQHLEYRLAGILDVGRDDERMEFVMVECYPCLVEDAERGAAPLAGLEDDDVDRYTLLSHLLASAQGDELGVV